MLPRVLSRGGMTGQASLQGCRPMGLVLAEGLYREKEPALGVRTVRQREKSPWRLKEGRRRDFLGLLFSEKHRFIDLEFLLG